MTPRAYLWFTAVLVAAAAGCSGGGSNTPQCSFKDPATLAQSSWPKFRHDVQNTGAVENAQLATNPAQCRWVFPASPLPGKGPFPASAALNAAEDLVYIGSTDGTLYAIQSADGEQRSTFNFLTNLQQPITASALIGLRDSKDAVFVGGGDSRLSGVDDQGNAQASNWPFLTGGFVTAAPTLGTDGTLYVAAVNGVFSGVCPNGVVRFSLSTISLQSSPAIGPDGTVYFGADDNQLRAIRADGILNWAFSASAPIATAPVVEVANGATTAIYIADVGGHIFKVDANGHAVEGFNSPRFGRITSSPALAGDRLYVGSDDGNLYAVDTATGEPVWSFPTTGLCTDPAATLGRSCNAGSDCDTLPGSANGTCDRAVASSPAVATSGTERTVVVGSNGGRVYFVPDAGTTFGTPVVFDSAEQCAGSTPAAVRSSPAIGSDGTVYVGADDGRVYAIGAPL